MEGQENLNLELILIAGTAGMLLLAGAVVTFIYLYQRKLIKKKIDFQQIEQMLQKQELKSAYAMLEGQDIERQRIAVEMHDALGSRLVTLTMYAESFLKGNLSGEQRLIAEKMLDMAQNAHAEARSISHKLDTGVVKHFGLEATLKDLADVINQSNSVKVQLHSDIKADMSNEISHNLYRITQELLNNTLKHARASEITINVTQVNNEYISFIYEDNGQGLPSTYIESKGIGMRNVFSRIEKLNGEYTLGKKGLSGFTMIIEIPL